MFYKLLLYVNTLRFLRPVQFFGRARFLAWRPNPDLNPSPPLRSAVGEWIEPCSHDQTIVGDGVFFVLGESGNLAEDGWDNPKKSKLWRYNQHYFTDLGAPRAGWHGCYSDLIERWIEDHPPAEGTGWEPYPTSLRIVNWLKYSLSGERLSLSAQHSLAIQTRWLGNRLEWHLLGNHLFANAKALMFAGLYFDGREAALFRKKALRILKDQVTEQFLSDGGHFELSPMYHALALEDILDLVNLLNCYSADLSTAEIELKDRLVHLVPEMQSWLAVMSHPDGKISFFNDAAFGIAAENSDLCEYASRLGFISAAELDGITHLAPSGYARIQRGPAVLISDVAKIGPDYLPCHAHADTLSFELTLFGERLFVNSGTSEYGLSSERHRQRGTAAHNTVVVEEKNSSEVWAGFRVARRARVQNIKVEQSGDVALVSAGHNGYRRLASALVHNRQLKLTTNSLTVTDKLTFPRSGRARFHIHPGVKVSMTESGKGNFQMPGGHTLTWCAPDAVLEDSTWHPAFGECISSSCLVVELLNGCCELKLHWA